MKRQDLISLWDGESGRYIGRSADLSEWPFDASFLPENGAVILDAGCGAGRYLGMFERISEHRFGVDISPAMVRAANRFGKCVVGDIGALPFPDLRFDYVMSINVLGHCGRPLEALSELARVCRPRGTVVLIAPHTCSFVSFFRKLAIVLGRYTLKECRVTTLGKLVSEGEKMGLALEASSTWIRRSTNGTLPRSAVGTAAYYFDIIFRAMLPVPWGECVVVKFRKRPF